MLRASLASFLAAVIMFFWGFVFWTLSPLPAHFISAVPDEAAAQQALRDLGLRSGAYFIPYGMGADPAEFARRHEQGPIAKLYLTAGGAPPMDVSALVAGFVHMFVSALCMATLLGLVLSALPQYSQRVGFVLVCGLTGAIFARLGDPIWYGHPWGFELITVLYQAVAWLLAGCVLAAFIRPGFRFR